MDSHIILFIQWNRILKSFYTTIVNYVLQFSPFHNVLMWVLSIGMGKGWKREWRVFTTHISQFFWEDIDAVSLAWHPPSCICITLSYWQIATYVPIALAEVLHDFKGTKAPQVLTKITWILHSIFYSLPTFMWAIVPG